MFWLSNRSYSFEKTTDLYSKNNDHINLVTGDYNYVKGKKGNWFVDRGKERPTTTTNATSKIQSTTIRFVNITKTVINISFGETTTSSEISTATGETATSATSDHEVRTSTDEVPTSTIADEASQTSTDGAVNTQTKKSTGMSLRSGAYGLTLWVAGAVIMLGHAF